MPELPDLLHVLARLREALEGRRVTAERVREPVVLRFLVQGNLSLLLGRPLITVFRRAHFLVFRFDGLELAVNPMLAGRFRLADPSERTEAALAFALTFEETPERAPDSLRREREGGEAEGRGGVRSAPPPHSIELRYLDDKKMGKAYLTAEGDWRAIPGIGAVGVDVLSPQFTPERFVSLLRHRRDQVRAFLLDKSALDSLGNAYADEVLFDAGIHPKTPCRALSHDDAIRLHGSIVKVMSEAVAEVSRRAEPIEVKVRDFLKVRLKEDCPRCGGRIRRAGVRGMDAYFCPRCQPATRPGLVDWTRTPR
jgi:formamidopyrimidine-DNA glycosylase